MAQAYKILFTFTDSQQRTLTVRFDNVSLVVSVMNGTTEILSGGNEAHPHVNQLFTDTKSDGSTVRYTGMSAFPYAQQATVTEEPEDPTPPDGTYIRTQCYGFDRYNVVANGTGGERQGSLVEANSPSCGYVAPVLGCTDPTADNYNPNATPGNADENACTYTYGALSEVKVIEVRPCPSDGIYLQWYNSLGGIDGWLFQGKIDTLFASEPTSTFSYGSGLRSATGKVLTPSVVVNTSELNYNRFQAICELFASPLVWMYQGTEKVPVYVEPASDLGQRNIGQSSYSLQVRISLQPLNALKN
jgi:hypothetical protein